MLGKPDLSLFSSTDAGTQTEDKSRYKVNRRWCLLIFTLLALGGVITGWVLYNGGYSVILDRFSKSKVETSPTKTPLNSSTAQPLNASTAQHLNASTLLPKTPLNASTSRFPAVSTPKIPPWRKRPLPVLALRPQLKIPQIQRKAPISVQKLLPIRKNPPAIPHPTTMKTIRSTPKIYKVKPTSHSISKTKVQPKKSPSNRSTSLVKPTTPPSVRSTDNKTFVRKAEVFARKHIGI